MGDTPRGRKRLSKGTKVGSRTRSVVLSDVLVNIPDTLTCTVGIGGLVIEVPARRADRIDRLVEINYGVID